ncbi:hypothetical protein ACSVBT_12810 [Afipia sp. TerB]
MARDLSHIHLPLSGGDRKALNKELRRAHGMTRILQNASIEKRAAGEALIREADDLACQSWNERMWCDGGPAQPSPTIGQALNAGYRWLEVVCTRCRRRISVDLTAVNRKPDVDIWTLETSLRHERCRRRNETPFTVLKQLAKTEQYSCRAE